MKAVRSRASDSRSTSRSVRIGAGGQATGPSPDMTGNLSHARESDPKKNPWCLHWLMVRSTSLGERRLERARNTGRLSCNAVLAARHTRREQPPHRTTQPTLQPVLGRLHTALEQRPRPETSVHAAAATAPVDPTARPTRSTATSPHRTERSTGLWSPASGSDRAPLVLMGHSGGTPKNDPASQRGYLPATPGELRNDRNAARSSLVKMSGTSQAAK